MKNTITLTVRLFLATTLLISSLTLITPKTGAADGDLDTTFDGDGKVRTDFNASDDGGNAVAFQADGKIVVAGFQTVSAATQFGLARYNPDGSLDTTFDGDGKVATSIGFSSSARALAFQSDGKIVVVGTTDLGLNDSDFAVVRYNTNGSLDTSFGTTGVVLTRFLTGIDNIAHAVAIQADGKFVVAGESSILTMDGSFFKNFAIARYNTNGSLDTTFSEDGKLTTAFAVNAAAKSVSVQSDGKITTAGSQNLARYSSTGALDSSFGTGGRVFINNISISAAKIQSDGNIVVAGSTTVSGDSHFGLARITPSGFFDTTFGTGGRVSTSFGTLNHASALVIQTDGRIIAAGFSRISTSNVDFALARYNTNGSLDASFSSDGKVTTDILANDNAAGTALQPDGKIVVVGKADAGLDTSDFALVRYQNSGTVVQRPHLFDFDGDFRDDFSVFRPSDSAWYIQKTTDGFSAAVWGLADDKLTPGDYNGDGKTDIAVWRANPFGDAKSYFFILQSNGNVFRSEQFGQPGDSPAVVGDWNRDGRDDVAVYRAGNPGGQSFFFFRTPTTAPGGFETVPWGTGGDIAVQGDFDGDDRNDPAVFRPSDRAWYIRRSSDGLLRAVQWGLETDMLVPADYDGDGATDIAIFRPSSGLWCILRSSDGGMRFQQWGVGSDRLTPADYDGDGETDIAVWRPADGAFYVLNSATLQLNAFRFGTSGDVPIPSVFVPNP